MNTQTKEVSSNVDVLKYILSLVLISAGVVAFYQFSDYSQLYRVLGIVAIVVVSLAIMLTTAVGRHSWLFAQEARQEVRKVVWPSRSETMQTTLMVFAMVVIVGFLLWLLDMFLFWAIASLTT
ncbi:preprotein translocase subunit SecE [Bathymodiolus platifrons methanotrophic gill symbiont]|uniref:preprotein translocase subunit SecE n=1 Tax=Bathymodiolus platifrons methanotrophic gill symbiont TaxID=113268 RepID=UPI000B408315|nr:preprotein translocase subunit SecE [Bathymodiolus platifrons methanotrophic gill symbiont]MCK5869433.1 preprotein translocase subunit SecE [Methyloprofundus sp.]TXK97400.1 preprotein translocase subunit SecE [Methylococcaceae bacterium CS4]TXK99750.1 preprotein translocase subunit SecE [Methylococcaceae bacterium CS5]TXL06571.1 preprotein translocase subunit SecE [Methylococcaceae bacterium CS1]TXL09511.1 preprotein translocase subunit SecE [Methylococcaceae bacterium CS3]TXL12177.1 prepr